MPTDESELEYLEELGETHGVNPIATRLRECTGYEIKLVGKSLEFVATTDSKSCPNLMVKLFKNKNIGSSKYPDGVMYCDKCKFQAGFFASKVDSSPRTGVIYDTGDEDLDDFLKEMG